MDFTISCVISFILILFAGILPEGTLACSNQTIREGSRAAFSGSKARFFADPDKFVVQYFLKRKMLCIYNFLPDSIKSSRHVVTFYHLYTSKKPIRIIMKKENFNALSFLLGISVVFIWQICISFNILQFSVTVPAEHFLIPYDIFLPFPRSIINVFTLFLKVSLSF